MGFFNNWILSRAAKITAKNESIKANEIEKHRLARELSLLIKGQTLEKLNEFIDIKIEEFQKTPCHINEGDTAILNIYNLGRSGNNGWDGGPYSLLQHIPIEERTRPVIVKITKLYVDRSLSSDLIDKFYDDYSEAILENALLTDSITKLYTRWINDHRPKGGMIGDQFGLYWTAHFDYDSSFKPKWGLNSNSFLPQGTPEFDETCSIWAEEILLDTESRKIDEEIKQLRSRRAQIQEKYHNIKLININSHA